MEKEVHRAEASARQAENANDVLIRIQAAIDNMQTDDTTNGDQYGRAGKCQ
jgi:hypothetical protein